MVGIIEADAEAARVGSLFLHQGHHQGRVDAARQVGPNRHIGLQPVGHRQAQGVIQLLLCLGGAGQPGIKAARHGRVDAPVLPPVHAAALLEHQGLARLHPVHAFEDRFRPLDVAPSQIVGQSPRIDAELQHRQLAQRLQLRGKGHAPIALHPIEWFLSQAVARQRESVGIAFEQPPGPHALCAFAHAVRTPGRQGVQQHLGVTVAVLHRVETGMVVPHAAPAPHQFITPGAVVVDLAIEHQHPPLGGVDHRLCSRWAGVADGQASMGQCKALFRCTPHAVAMRAAVHHGIGHCPCPCRQCAGLGWLRHPQTRDGAHGQSLLIR